MRELEHLVSGFELGPDGQKKEIKVTEDSLSPAVILDTTRRTLQVYKKNLDRTTEEVISVLSFPCSQPNECI